MFLYESHLGGLYYTNEKLPFERLYCDECGDSDTLLGAFYTEEELKQLLEDEDLSDSPYADNIFTEAFRKKETKNHEVLDAEFLKKEARVNRNGLNKKLRITEDTTVLRKFGFLKVSRREGVMKYSRFFTFKGLDVGFYVTYRPLAPEGERLEIDVLDEAFLQPYDYQEILRSSGYNEHAAKVWEFVESEMERLSRAGVITGHRRGAYI